MHYHYLRKLPAGHYLFTSESVAPGHPDKVCDQIADTLLDEFIANDPNAKVAIEIMASNNNVVISGETQSQWHLSSTQIDFIVRNCLQQIGYSGEQNFSWQNVGVINFLHRQSREISACVEGNGRKKGGAGDQGIMFGYACKETEAYMPAAIYYANRIIEYIVTEIKNGNLAGLGPDAKSQVTLEYDANHQPIGVRTIVVSIQHHKKMSQSEIKKSIKPIVDAALPIGWICPDDAFLVNPSGKFTIGGPESDTGMTGRKIIVDTYGGSAPHGGGAFSGKDPSKVDRSAAYMARYLAKNIVAAGMAERCTVQLSYAIGIPEPISLLIDTAGTGLVCNDELNEAIIELVDLSPLGIRDYLQLNQPIYAKTAVYGHFGRPPQDDGSFSWEKLDFVPQLKQKFALHNG